MKEPQIHSHITDVLDNDHPLAWENVNCISCGKMVHAFNNECMSTWVETGCGNFCITCFMEEGKKDSFYKQPHDVLVNRFGLKEDNNALD